MGGRARAALAAALVIGAVLVPAGSAAGQSVPNPDWTSLLPAAPGTSNEPQPGPVPYCETPSVGCIDVEIQRLTELRDRLGCDHRAVFATTYLELTKAIRTAVDTDAGMFDDLDYLFTEDALFANFYFDTLAAWDRGEAVPPAWRIALQQAERGEITGAQEMLLGINAHVQNDMPFVIAALGVRTPDGASRKPDHDAVNEVLNRAYAPVVAEIRRRYDPLIGVTNPDGVPADDLAGLEMVRGWREGVWRNAERLLTARTEAQRWLVASQIQANAGLWAQGIATAQVPGIRASRDAYCQAQSG